MAQAQIEALKIESDNPSSQHKPILCVIDQDLQLKVKTLKKKPVLVLVKGSNTMMLSVDTFERLCAMKSILSLLYQEGGALPVTTEQA